MFWCCLQTKVYTPGWFKYLESCDLNYCSCGLSLTNCSSSSRPGLALTWILMCQNIFRDRAAVIACVGHKRATLSLKIPTLFFQTLNVSGGEVCTYMSRGFWWNVFLSCLVNDINAHKNEGGWGSTFGWKSTCKLMWGSWICSVIPLSQL